MKYSNFKNLRAPQEYLIRKQEEEFSPSPYRTEFDRDRDRILYSKAFRRLKGKTQVFLTDGEDHLRTRLTHTLEVSQIARIAASNLGLDGILTEAISLGHDLGHTPFGHVGERTLNEIMNNCDTVGQFQSKMLPIDKGFKHNWQGIRVLAELEKLYGNPGLNITNFTLWGVLNHSSSVWKKCSYYFTNDDENCFLHRNPQGCKQTILGSFDLGFYEKYRPRIAIKTGTEAWSFEGFIVAWVDEIAQRHHDMEDAVIMGLIDREELIEILDDNFKDFYSGQTTTDRTTRKIFEKLRLAKTNQEFLPYLSKFVVNFYTNQFITTSAYNLGAFILETGLSNRKEFIQQYPTLSVKSVKNVIGYSPELLDKDRVIQEFLRDRILNSHRAQQMDGKGRF